MEQLASYHRVIPVRLALFAKMFEDREWSPNALDIIQGAKGVGVAFLRESFDSRFADRRLQRHQRAAQLVLKALLPEDATEESGYATDIREGGSRSYRELSRDIRLCPEENLGNYLTSSIASFA